MKNEDKIPKIIHYCWFGKNKKSEVIEKCIQSWKKYLPEYEIREWNDEDVQNIECNYVQEAFSMKKYAFVSDYFRLYALYNYGGIYFDTDNQIFKSFDDFLDLDFFTGYENWKNKISPFTAVVGAKKHNIIVKELLSEYDNIHFILSNNEFDMTTNTKRVSNYFNLKYNLCPPYDENSTTILEQNCVIFPSNYFCKYKNNVSYAVHLFNASWVYEYKDNLSFLQKIFSITKEQKNGVKRKVLTILGLKIKYKDGK